MQIRCPVCDYSREANLAKIPPTAEFATCPKCRHRFRFRALDLDTIERPEPEGPKPEHADVWDAMDSLHDRWQETDRQDNDDSADDGDKDEHTPCYTQGQTAEADIPWENPRPLGYFQSFLRTTFWILFHPSNFFAILTRRPALFPALTFYLLFSIFQYICKVFWFQVLGRMMREEFVAILGEEMYTKAVENAVENLILTPAVLTVPFGLTIQLVGTVAVVYLLVRIMAPENADFALTFKVASYASAGLVLTAVPVLGIFLGPIVYFVLLLIGCRSAFGLSWIKAVLTLIPLYLIIILGSSAQFL